MIDILQKSASTLLQVTVVALVLGAGLPAIYSLGMKALTIGRPISADGHDIRGKASPLGLTLAGICFAVVIGAVIFGILVIIFGKKVLGGH